MKKSSILLIFFVFFLNILNSNGQQELSSQEYSKLKLLFGIEGISNTEGGMIITKKENLDDLNLASDMIENGNEDPAFSNRVIILCGKLAEDLQYLLKSVGLAVYNVKKDFLVVSGKSAELILKEFVDTGIVLKHCLDSTNENLVMLGSNVIKHASLIVANLMATGLLEAATFMVVMADNLWTIAYILYARAGLFIQSMAESDVQIIKYMAKGLLRIVQITRTAVIIAVAAIKLLTTLTKIAIDGTVRIIKISVEAINETREELMEALQPNRGFKYKFESFFKK